MCFPRAVCLTVLMSTIAINSSVAFAQRPDPRGKATAQEPSRKEFADLANEMDRLAADIAGMLEDKASRNTLAARIARTRNVEGKLVLREFLNQLQKRTPIDLVTKIEARLRRMNATNPHLHVYFPVPAHRKGFSPTAEFLVAAPPPTLEDSKASSFSAYVVGGGKRDLQKKEPPTQPTLIIAVAETDTLTPGPRLKTVRDPSREKLPQQEIEDAKQSGKNCSMGIPYVWFRRTHERWWQGDPEIFVMIYRWGPEQIYAEKRQLYHVDSPNVWYDLDDHNTTYRFWNDTYERIFTFEFWEDDVLYHRNQIGRSDDFMGRISVDREHVSWGRYLGRLRTDGDGEVQLYVDKDHSDP